MQQKPFLIATVVNSSLRSGIDNLLDNKINSFEENNEVDRYRY
jgi:hypothetical protein